MEVAILGPVEVENRGRRTSVEVPKERALLEVLAANAGHAVSPDRLVDALWGDNPPPTAEKTLQGHVWRLRRTLGDDRLTTDAGGYTLRVDGDDVDVNRFERLIAEGSSAARASDPSAARRAFAGALALWRGDPMGDLADGPFRSSEEARLAELRMLAVEGRIAADLALGRHAEVLPELEALVANAPLREPMWAHLMLALYRSGRQADALRAYARLRATLAAEVGLDPSPALRRIEARILRQDPQLDLVAPAPYSNMPVGVSSFVGRRREMAEVSRLLEEHRLVTLLGPAGTGKTRLALELAARRPLAPDGTWWIDLTPLRAGDAVADRVAAVLGVPSGPGAAADALEAYVRHRDLLLVLDNCEHVLGAAADLVERLLTAGSAARVMATSRAPLDVEGEQRVAVAPLPVPTAGCPRTEGAEDAVRLYVDRCSERGRRIDALEMDDVEELARRLDGLPLAIELAAARTVHASVRDVLAGLAAGADVLARRGRVRDDRHRSLRSALDWSYHLLDDDSRHLFDRCSVFAGDFDVEAAAAVDCDAGDEGVVAARLDALVDTSLIGTSETVLGRFRLLESVRAYALDHLAEEGQRAATEKRHADYFRGLARRIGDEIGAESEGYETEAWLSRARLEDANIRAAVHWSLVHDDPAVTLEFASSVGWAGLLGRDPGTLVLLRRILARVDGAPPSLVATAWMRLVWTAWEAADVATAADALERGTRAAADAADAGDARELAWALASRGFFTAMVCGCVDDVLASFDGARAAHDRAGSVVARARTEIMRQLALVLLNRYDGLSLDDLMAAERVVRAATDHHHVSMALITRAIAAGREWRLHGAGDVASLQAIAEEAVAEARFGSSLLGNAQVGAAYAAFLAGDEAYGRTLLLRSAREMLDFGNDVFFGIPMQLFAVHAFEAGDLVRAARLWGAATAVTPHWPGLYVETTWLLPAARRELGERFDREVAAGRRLSPEDTMRLAIALGEPQESSEGRTGMAGG